MTHHPHHPHPIDHLADEREQVLLGRVVDREASPDDWAELERLAQHDPALWTRLAHAERAHARLASAVEDAIAIAECIALPNQHPHAIAHQPAAPRRARRLLAALPRSTGWAVAACLALALALRWNNPAAEPAPHQPTEPSHLAAAFDPFSPAPSHAAPAPQAHTVANHFANDSTDELWSGYVRRGAIEGRVLREMPAAIIQIQQTPDGHAYEILFERRVVERRVVSPTEAAVRRVSIDEFGRPVAVPVQQPASLTDLLGTPQRPI